jgi:hypothetical protein
MEQAPNPFSMSQAGTSPTAKRKESLIHEWFKKLPVRSENWNSTKSRISQKKTEKISTSDSLSPGLSLFTPALLL